MDDVDRRTFIAGTGVGLAYAAVVTVDARSRQTRTP